jgi:hypothetical protein
MATSINGIYDSRAIQPIHWQKELVRLGLRERLYAERLGQLAERVHQGLPRAAEWIAAKGVQNGLIESIVALVGQRLVVLNGVDELPAATARTAR